MTTKQPLTQVLGELPDNATMEDALERLLFMAKIERGLLQAEIGRTIPQAQVKELSNS